MNKLFCILGKSGSGKSTLEKAISETGICKKVVSTTTRPRREKEIEGVDYHYITQDEFYRKLRNNEFIEYTVYNNWFYGIEKNAINFDKGSYIVVVEPRGFNMIVNTLPRERVVSIFVDVDDKTRLIRSLLREKNPDIDEIVRRYQSDKSLFNGVEKIVDYVIKNEKIQEASQELMEIIVSEIGIKKMP